MFFMKIVPPKNDFKLFSGQVTIMIVFRLVYSKDIIDFVVTLRIKLAVTRVPN